MKNLQTLMAVYAKYAEKFLKFRENIGDINFTTKFVLAEDSETVEFDAWGVVGEDTTAITITDIWRSSLYRERITPANIKACYEDAARRIEDYLAHKEERIAEYLKKKEDGED